MGQMIGADPEQLDALGNKLTASADRLDSIRGEIGALLSHSHWEGHDADDFRGMWHHRLSGALLAAAHATRDGASALHVNATQQRDASSSDGGNGFVGLLAPAFSGDTSLFSSINTFVGGYHSFDGIMKWMDGIGMVSASMSYIASGALKGSWARALASKISSLPDVVKMGVVNEAKDLKGFARIAPIAEKAGTALGALGIGVDVFDLGSELAKDPGSAGTFKAGFDLLFDAGTLATAECPPLSLGIFAVHQMGDYLIDHPEVTKAIGDGVANAARTVADVAGSVVHAEVEVGKAVIDGGVNMVKSIFHW